jgi:hypothetical protein
MSQTRVCLTDSSDFTHFCGSLPVSESHAATFSNWLVCSKLASPVAYTSQPILSSAAAMPRELPIGFGKLLPHHRTSERWPLCTGVLVAPFTGSMLFKTTLANQELRSSLTSSMGIWPRTAVRSELRPCSSFDARKTKMTGSSETTVRSPLLRDRLNNSLGTAVVRRDSSFVGQDWICYKSQMWIDCLVTGGRHILHSSGATADSSRSV